jgi:hypothetical protein
MQLAPLQHGARVHRRGGALYELNDVDPELEMTWFPPLLEPETRYILLVSNVAFKWVNLYEPLRRGFGILGEVRLHKLKSS